jgi:hypothetical protein
VSAALTTWKCVSLDASPSARNGAASPGRARVVRPLCCPLDDTPSACRGVSAAALCAELDDVLLVPLLDAVDTLTRRSAGGLADCLLVVAETVVTGAATGTGGRVSFAAGEGTALFAPVATVATVGVGRVAKCAAKWTRKCSSTAPKNLKYSRFSNFGGAPCEAAEDAHHTSSCCSPDSSRRNCCTNSARVRGAAGSSPDVFNNVVC